MICSIDRQHQTASQPHCFDHGPRPAGRAPTTAASPDSSAQATEQSVYEHRVFVVNDGGILIKSSNCVHVRIRQLKIKDIEVLFDALSPD